MDSPARGQIQKQVGDTVIAAGGLMDLSRGGEVAAQAAGQHPAGQKIIAGGGEAGATAADTAHARSEIAAGRGAKGIADSLIAPLLEGGELRPGPKQRG